jgi:hypothetical protein
VQHHAADQLHVEVAHVHDAPAGLADDCEGLGQKLVEDMPLRLEKRLGAIRFVSRDRIPGRRDPLPELDSLRAQSLIRERL